MVKRIPEKAWYNIRDPKNFYVAMRDDVKLLFEHRAYLSLTTIIVCCLDAIAASGGHASKATFSKFVVGHFPGLVKDIERARPGKTGADVLYEEFRNGFAHLRGPKPSCAIAENHELDGDWAGIVEIPGGAPLLAINVDRLAQEFLALVERLNGEANKHV
jgi:hypothetical protein